LRRDRTQRSSAPWRNSSGSLAMLKAIDLAVMGLHVVDGGVNDPYTVMLVPSPKKIR
jgi:hypothetical protein